MPLLFIKQKEKDENKQDLIVREKRRKIRKTGKLHQMITVFKLRI